MTIVHRPSAFMTASVIESGSPRRKNNPTVVPAIMAMGLTMTAHPEGSSANRWQNCHGAFGLCAYIAREPPIPHVRMRAKRASVSGCARTDKGKLYLRYGS